MFVLSREDGLSLIFITCHKPLSDKKKSIGFGPNSTIWDYENQFYVSQSPFAPQNMADKDANFRLKVLANHSISIK